MTELVRYRMLIDGAWVDAGDGGAFESMNPATGEPWAVIPEATAADVGRAVEAAHRAFTEGPWSRTTPTERGRSLRRLADLLADRSEQLGRTETVDTGKMLKETRWQAKYIADFFHFFAGCADKVHGATLPIDKPDLCRELRRGLAGARRQVAVHRVRGRGPRKRGQRLHRRHLRSQRPELRGRLAAVLAGAHRRPLPGRHW